MTIESVKGPALKRIEIIDSLRGFSLLGILISHLCILFEAFDGSTLNASDPSIINIIISVINGLFFSGKYFAIFSFLFGLSFFIQMDRAATKGINFQWRFLWRIIILMVVGYLHSLLFSGDILIIYAILGIFLVFMFRVKNKMLVFLIIALLSGLPRFISYSFKHLPGKTNTTAKSNSMEENMVQMSKLYRTGSLKEVVQFNAVEGLKAKADYQLGVEGRGYQTLALFILGLLVGRSKYFEQIEGNLPLTRKIFKRSIWFTLAFLLIVAGLFTITKGDMENFLSLIGMTFYNLFNLSLALFITTAFIILYQGNKMQKFFQQLVPYGRMGLTNYLFQSIIFIPLFYGFGAGLANKINLGIALVLGMIIFYFQLKLSKWWLDRFMYGPFEWLWRSLTWLKWQPLRKSLV